ncbi:MAG: flippase-like domain-containing protein [Bryobacteraceae bacterium]|nr:flippase-like domain-containing protein [Bryobacteraceae bacterium]
MSGREALIRNRLKYLAVAGLLAVVVWLLMMRVCERGFDWSLLARTLLGVHWGWLGAAVGFVLLTYYGRVLRWSVMIRPICPHPSHWRLFSATAIGFTALVFFGRPGELLRPYLIARNENLPFSSQMAAWLLERVYDLLAVVLIFGFALTRIPQNAALGPALQWTLETGGYAVWILALVCVSVLFVLRQYSGFARRRIIEALEFLPSAQHRKVSRFVDSFVRGIEATRNSRAAFLLLFYTVVEWLLIGVCYYCLFQAFPATAGRGWMDVLAFMGLVAFGSIVQLPGIGGGMQVMAVITLTELLGTPLEAATGIALALWVITFVVIMPVGVLFACYEGLSWRKIKELEKEVAL